MYNLGQQKKGVGLDSGTLIIVVLGVVPVVLYLRLQARLRRLEILSSSMAHAFQSKATGREHIGSVSSFRAPVNLLVNITVGKATFNAHLRDLSKSGCRLEIEEPVTVGTQLSVKVPGESSVLITAMVRRVLTELEIGIEFVAPDKAARQWITLTLNKALKQVLEQIS